jgi:hypothetical protein
MFKVGDLVEVNLGTYYKSRVIKTGDVGVVVNTEDDDEWPQIRFFHGYIDFCNPKVLLKLKENTNEYVRTNKKPSKD